MPVLTAAAVDAVFKDRLRALGYSAAFTAEKAAALEALFCALSREDPARLFHAPDCDKEVSRLIAENAPPENGAAAAAYRSALTLLEGASFPRQDAAEREEGPVPAPPAVPSGAEGQETDAPQRIPPPTVRQVRRVLDAVRGDAAYAETEKKRAALFAPQPEEDETLLAARLAFAAGLCGRSPQDPSAAAGKLAGTAVSAQARLGSMELLRDLAALLDPAMRTGVLRWVVRLCACYAPAYYPVSNDRIDAALRYFRDEEGFYPFLNRDLQDYMKYRRILLLFRRKYGLQQFSLPEVALYLEAEGRKIK